jgi:hypothetical protein
VNEAEWMGSASESESSGRFRFRGRGEMITVETGQHFGAWVVATVDRSGKRATCVCACGAAGQIVGAALIAGESKGCRRRMTPRPRVDLCRPAPSFSADLARDQGYAALHRHRARPWRQVGLWKSPSLTSCRRSFRNLARPTSRIIDTLMNRGQQKAGALAEPWP